VTTVPASASLGAERARQPYLVNERFHAFQKRYALATILLPLAGTIVALGLLAYRPIGSVEIGLLFAMYFVTSLGMTVGFHRHFAHRSFRAHPALRAVLGVLGSMAGQGTLVSFVAMHRRHHQFSEREFDPHSPYVDELGRPMGRFSGLWHSHIGWMLESHPTNTTRFARDLIQDPMVHRVSKLYLLWVLMGLLIPTALGGLLTLSAMGALTGLLWGGFVRLFVVDHLMWTSGSTAHIFGSRPFDTSDRSTNNFILALPNLGEAWHNNHHAFPQAALFSVKWWQVDVGGLVIRAFEKLGWASNVGTPERDMVVAKEERDRASAVSAAVGNGDR